MQVVSILSKHLSKVMHKTRLKTLCVLVESLYRYKSPAKGRHRKTKRGNILQNSQSKKHAKANKEPWLLVSSLEKNHICAKK